MTSRNGRKQRTPRQHTLDRGSCTSTLVFTSAHFPEADLPNQQKELSMEEWTERVYYIQEGCGSILHHHVKEINHTQQDEYHMVSLPWGSYTKYISIK